MSPTTTPTRHGRSPAALSGPGHPLDTREKRTRVNYALRSKGIPAKACSTCWTIKSIADFERKASASDGLGPCCRTCKSQTHAQRMTTNAEYREKRRVLAHASYHRTYPHRRKVIQERVKQRRAEYLVENADRVRDPNVLKRCAGQCGQLLPETEFRLNRGVAGGLRARCAHCSDACRRARRVCLQAYGDPVGQVCYLCGDVIEGRSEAWVDHVIPQSQGGPDIAENLRWTHSVCNIRRQTNPPTDEQMQRLQLIVPTFPGVQK